MDKEILHLLERGREHYENREYDKAEAYLLKVAENQDGFADVMNMLGVIYHDKGQVGSAQEYFEKALRINPKYTEAALNLALHMLVPGGFFVCKVFQGAAFRAFADSVRSGFHENRIFKPKSSRKASKEIYIIGKGRK